MRVGRSAWVVSAAMAGLVALAPEARASWCPELELSPIFGASIPADGVLGFWSTQSLTTAYVTLTRDATAEEVPSEVNPSFLALDVVVVRPLAPLVVGESYRLVIHALDSCTGASFADEFSIHVDPPGVPATAPPAATADYSVVSRPFNGEESDELICCDRDDYLGDDRSRCTEAQARIRLQALVRVDASAPDLHGQIATFAAGPPGEIVAYSGEFEDDAEFCVTPGALHLVTGARVDGAPICADAALIDQLGVVEIDPRDVLPCRQPFAICRQDRLFPPSCRHWSACECRADLEATPPLWVVILAAFGRRRRPRPRPEATIADTAE